jgi:hypothetical protein
MKIPNKFKARAPTSKLSWTAMVIDRPYSSGFRSDPLPGRIRLDIELKASDTHMLAGIRSVLTGE